MNQPTNTPLVNVNLLTYIETPSHGYLRTPFDELLKLPPDALAKISRCSFLDLRKRLAYLEEDCDLPQFIRSAQLSADDWKAVRQDYSETLDRGNSGFIDYAAAHVKAALSQTIHADRRELARALAFVAAAMSEDPNRQALNGVALEIKRGEDTALFIATDGRRLHAYSCPLTSAAPCDLGALLTRAAVEALTSSKGALNFKRAEKLKAADQIALTFERSEALADWLKSAWIEIGGERYLNETAFTFPNWRAVLPKPREFEAQLDFSLLAAALDAHDRACQDFLADCLTQAAPRINAAFNNGGSALRADVQKKIERDAKRELRSSDLALNLAIEIIQPTRYTYTALPKLRRLVAKLNERFEDPRLTSPDELNPAAHLNLRVEYVRHAVEACALLSTPPAVGVELDPINRTPTLAPIQLGNHAHLYQARSGFVVIMPMRLT